MVKNRYYQGCYIIVHADKDYIALSMMEYFTLLSFCVIAIIKTHADQTQNVCNIEINNSGSELSTPNYPNVFPSDVDCTQIVRFSPNKTILLTFLSFNLETSGSDADDCHNWLDIHDGVEASTPLLGNRLCGKVAPEKILSTRNEVLLKFHSGRSFWGNNGLGGYRIKVEEGSHLQCACKYANRGSEQNGIVCKEHGSLTASTSCAPDESCVGVHWTMTSNLASAVMELCDKTFLVETYQKVNNSVCTEENAYSSYGTLIEAKVECYHDSTCIGVSDHGCNRIKYDLCKRVFITFTQISSCVYKKREMHSLPSDFIWSTKGKTCSKKDQNVLNEFFVPSISNTTKYKNLQHAIKQENIRKALLKLVYEARYKCERYCSSSKICWGCNAICQNERCKWIAISSCGTVIPWNGLVIGDIAQKPTCIDLRLWWMDTSIAGIKWRLDSCIGPFEDVIEQNPSIHSLLRRNEISRGHELMLTTRCCVDPKQTTLTCEVQSISQKVKGWRDNFLEVRGRRYCHDFIGYRAMRKLIMNKPSLDLITQTTDAMPGTTSSEEVYRKSLLIPSPPLDGCPTRTLSFYDSSNRSSSCYCEDHCKWDKCSLLAAPQSCLLDINGTCAWNPYENHWVAQVGKECYEWNIDFYANDLNERPSDENYARGAGSRNSLTGCQQLCESTKLCQFFTYHPKSNGCFLKTSDSGRTAYTGSHGRISGPKECPYSIPTVTKSRPSFDPKMKFKATNRQISEKLRKLRKTSDYIFIVLTVMFSTAITTILFYSPKKIAKDPKILLNRAKVVFLLICFFLTAWMSMKQIERFLENRDASSIRYKRFNESPLDKYPTFSLCFKGPEIYWMNEKSLFDKFEVTSDQYVNIIKGNHAWKYEYDDESKAYRKIFINFNNLTGITFNESRLLLSDFVEDATYFSRKQHQSKVEEDDEPKRAEFRIGYRTADEICFARNSKDQIDVIRLNDMIELKKSLFEIGMQLNIQLRIIVHYPDQLLRAFDKPGLEVVLESYLKPPAIDSLTVKITQVTTLRKRPDSNIRCNPNIKNDDIKFQQEVIKQAGCIPIYWHYLMMSEEAKHYCRSPQEIERAEYFVDNYKTIQATYDPPCVDMAKVVTIDRHLGRTFDTQKKKILRIKYEESTYQEIENVQEFAFETFFSGIGGFVGIFLGYSMLQIPDLFVNALWGLQRLKYPVPIDVS